MRIGIDLLGAQSPHHGRRGIGRYSRDLAAALVARAHRDGDEYVLYRRPSLGTVGLEEVVDGDRIAWHDLPDAEDGEAAAQSDMLVRDDPDRLDALLVMSPFEAWAGYLPPSRPDHGGPALAAVVYDAIPFLFPPDGTPIHPDQRRLPHAARALRRFDALLAISESTRTDIVRLWKLNPSRVTAIGTAADEARFGLNVPGPSADELAGLGIDGPYVFCVGGMDARKNFHGLAEAFAKLPTTMRRSHRLVLACEMRADARAEAMRTVKRLGIGASLVLAGEVSDATLAALYRGCSAFAFPSLYEGFGLPVLEAMRCGAAVVAGDNSSLPEVVGDAGLLADASDPSAFASAVARVLGDPKLSATLRAKAIARASGFSWSVVAEKARAAIAGAVKVRGSAGAPIRKLRTRPRLAMVSPLPPRGSGIADYCASLVEELCRDYRIDLFHDGAYEPLPSLADPDLVAADVRMLPRLAHARDYRAIVYQMGNSRFHQFFYPLMLKYPGVVTLHDFCLAGFHQAYGYLYGIAPEHFASELEHGHSGRSDDVIRGLLKKRAAGPSEALTRACAERGLWVNRRVFEAAEAVIVHSPWCVERAREQAPEFAAKSVVVPMGTTLAEIDPDRRASTRERFGIPADALVVASFGYVHPDKMNTEAIAAFASVAGDDPRALFAFVGQEADGGEARAAADRLGVADRVRFLGRRSLDDFHALAEACDVGVNLRRPPTNGETSAALLDLIRWGIPTIVTDVATFADYPDHIVAKVDWSGGQPALDGAMRSLVLDPSHRRVLGSSAHDHVRRHHQWPDVASRYAEVIERASASRRSARLRGAS